MFSGSTFGLPTLRTLNLEKSVVSRVEVVCPDDRIVRKEVVPGESILPEAEMTECAAPVKKEAQGLGIASHPLPADTDFRMTNWQVACFIMLLRLRASCSSSDACSAPERAFRPRRRDFIRPFHSEARDRVLPAWHDQRSSFNFAKVGLLESFQVMHVIRLFQISRSVANSARVDGRRH